MNFSPGSSDISFAEEATEDFNKGTEDEELTSDFEKVAFSNLPGITCQSTTLTQSQINSADSTENTIIYDSIKPDHINIINLHVDSQLKPYHLFSNKSNSWIPDDPVLEEQRRKCIVQYLMSEEEISNDEDQHRSRYTSLNSLGTFSNMNFRRSSLDDILLRCCHSPDIFDNFRSIQSGDIDENGCSPMNEIMEHLEFQVNQRNERSHFILAELLIQTIEFIYSDELLRLFSPTSPVKGSTGKMTWFSEPDSLIHTMSVPIHQKSDTSQSNKEPCSKAETIAELLLDEIMHVSPFVDVRDKFSKGSPRCFQQLIQRLERQREFSCSFKQERSRPVNKYDSNQEADSCDQTESLSEETSEKIKALVESCNYPLNIPVGQYPVLGLNQCLPTYVSTMSPVLINQTTTLSTQNNKCPGCNLSFSAETARRLRLCRYYGFYFCSVCHSNTLMLIPAKILSNWDFTMLPVSCPARDFLKLIHSEPLFTVEHFSEKLRSSLPVLKSVIRLRHQGRLLLDFIETCRQGVPLKRAAMKFPSHWLSNSVQKFSLADFRLMESGIIIEELKIFASACVEHISICPLCQAQGFLCENCDNKTDVIFPFEIDKVYQCAQCHACSHVGCYERVKSLPCVKCERRKIRKEQIRNTALIIN